MEIIVGITGATGVIYGIRLLEVLKELEVKTHLILSNWGARTLELETEYDLEQVKRKAYWSYEEDDLSARISSGSYKTKGMIIAPCSMKTLSAIASGYNYNLIARAASVCLKEQRKLVILPRETPLSPVDLENMLKLARLGVVVLPPVPAFYAAPQSIDDIINHTLGKVLDCFDLSHDLFRRWNGVG